MDVAQQLILQARLFRISFKLWCHKVHKLASQRLQSKIYDNEDI